MMIFRILGGEFLQYDEISSHVLPRHESLKCCCKSVQIYRAPSIILVAGGLYVEREIGR